MFTAKRREASGWILHVLTEESGGVSSFSEEEVLARPLGQPTEGHEEACMRNGRSDMNGADSSNGATHSMT